MTLLNISGITCLRPQLGYTYVTSRRVGPKISKFWTRSFSGNPPRHLPYPPIDYCHLYKEGNLFVKSNQSLRLLQNMSIPTTLKEFLLSFIPKLLQLIPKFNPQHPKPSSCGDAVDPVEAPAEEAGLVVVHHHIHNMDWADLMICFCLSDALEMTSVYAQIKSQLPVTFHLLSLAILLAFACFFVSQFIRPKFLVPAQKLKNFGVFFSVTAIFMAITIPFPLYFKIATGAIYTISVFAIIICHCL